MIARAAAAAMLLAALATACPARGQTLIVPLTVAFARYAVRLRM